MKHTKINVKTKIQNYPIIIGSNLTKNISNILNSNSIKFKNCLLVIDKKIPKKKIVEIKKSLKNKNIFTFFFESR